MPTIIDTRTARRSDDSSAESDAPLKDAPVQSFGEYLNNPPPDPMLDENDPEEATAAQGGKPKEPHISMAAAQMLKDAEGEEEEEEGTFDDMVRRMRNQTTINNLDRQILEAAKKGDSEGIRQLHARGASLNAREPGANCVRMCRSECPCSNAHAHVHMYVYICMICMVCI